MRKHLDMAQTEKEFLQNVSMYPVHRLAESLVLAHAVLRTVPRELQHVLPVAEPSGQRNVTKSFAHLVSAFMHMLRINYGVTFPDANAAPLLWKCVREASLPREYGSSCSPTYLLAHWNCFHAQPSSISLAGGFWWPHQPLWDSTSPNPARVSSFASIPTVYSRQAWLLAASSSGDSMGVVGEIVGHCTM